MNSTQGRTRIRNISRDFLMRLEPCPSLSLTDAMIARHSTGLKRQLRASRIFLDINQKALRDSTADLNILSKSTQSCTSDFTLRANKTTDDFTKSLHKLDTLLRSLDDSTTLFTGTLARLNEDKDLIRKVINSMELKIRALETEVGMI